MRPIGRQRRTGASLEVHKARGDLLGVDRLRNLQCVRLLREGERDAHERASHQLGSHTGVLGDRDDQRRRDRRVAPQRDSFTSDRRSAVDRQQSKAVDRRHRVGIDSAGIRSYCH
jgi:hypothetical protein